MNGLASLGATADFGCGDFIRNVFEKIDGGALQVRDDLRRIPVFGFFLGIGSRNEAGRNDQAQGFATDPRTIGNDEIAQAEERFVFLPHRNVEECIGANHEKNAVAVTVIDVTEVTHRVYGIVELGAAEVFAGFGKGWNEVRVLSAGERNHGKSVRERREMLLQLVRRPAGGDEMDFVEIETAVGGAGDGQVAVVNGIERTAKESDAARLVFGSGAVRLRYGQCASQERVAGIRRNSTNFLMNL